MATVGDDRILAALRVLLERVQLATPGQVPDLLDVAAAELGWRTALYVVDYEQRRLVHVGTGGSRRGEALEIAGTRAGRAFSRVEPVPIAGDSPGLWVPLLDGVHRLGVVEITMPDGTDVRDGSVEEAYRSLVLLVGHVVAAKNAYGDALTRAARSRRRAVPSELLWDLLQPLSFACEGLVISGVLEPCYEVAADAFDYNVVDDVAHLAVLDGVGHDLRGTILTAVALAALRNSRREGLGLVETVRTTDRYLAQEAPTEGFVTGAIARLDLPTGVLSYVNAGHPAPLLLRHGAVVKELDGPRCPVLGLAHDEIPVSEESLHPGDCVLFYTDGITEARDAEGRFFGLDGLIAHVQRSMAAGLPAPETVRRLTHDVLDHQGGILQDDATLVLVQWTTEEEHRFVPSTAPARTPTDAPDDVRR
jgi:sigma-B regulation protein RsbU (phosphoserine phosphatase)